MTGYLQTVEWSIPQFILVLGAGLVAAAIASIAIVAAGAELTITALVWTIIAQNVGSLLALLYLSRRKGTGNLATDFGLEIHLRHWWGLPAGAALQFAAAILTAPLVRLLFPDGPPQQGIVTITEESQTVFDAALLIVALGILAPLWEEMTFRGMLLSRLVRSMAVWSAIMTQAAVFALIHLADPQAIAAIPGLFLIAAVLGYAALKSGNLSLPITLHAGVNLTAALLLLYGGDLLVWLEEFSGVEPTEALLRLVP